MKVSLNWLKELVDYQLSAEDLAEKISLASIGVKQQTEDYLELDLTYNRGDLLSMRGVAYEVAALTDSPLRFLTQTPEDFVWVNQDLSKTKVEIEDQNLASAQCVAKIENLTVGPSPKELVKKLEDSGMRSIDNITDITNLVMLEFGQPLHSFDAETVKNETIIVRAAKNEEEITTIDHKLRKLQPSDIVLADSEKPLDVAGIMGGENTEIKDSTTTILLSASLFNPINVRRTTQRLNLHSEASRRFQHGLSSIHTLQALDAAIRMYQDLGGKLTAITLTGNFETTEKKLDLRISKVNSLLGLNLDEETIIKCLQKLNFTVDSHRESGNVVLEVKIPYFRLDINIEEDLIEEVARIYGYEKIPPKELRGKLPEKLDQSLPNLIYDTKKALADTGLTEVQTYSFYSTQALKALGFNKTNQDKLIKVANPISSETEYLREFIWPNLVEVIGKNMRVGYKAIAIFEIGKVYLSVKGDLPKESYRLAIALMNGTDNPIEELIAIAEAEHLRGGKMRLHLGEGLKPATLFHPTRFATIEVSGKTIGGLAEVHPRFLNNFGIEKHVAILEITIESLS